MLELPKLLAFVTLLRLSTCMTRLLVEVLAPMPAGAATPRVAVGKSAVGANTVAAGAAIPDGSISVDIKYGGAETAHETVKLCDTTTCPTPATVGGCTSRNPVDP